MKYCVYHAEFGKKVEATKTVIVNSIPRYDLDLCDDCYLDYTNSEDQMDMIE